MRWYYSAATTILFLGLNCNLKGHELKFKPFEEIVYYFNLPPCSPLMYRTDSLLGGDKFEYQAMKVAKDGTPPYDLISSEGSLPLTSKGSDIWGLKIVFDPLIHMVLDARFFAEFPLLFPYFPKGRYHVGEQWNSVLPLPISFTTGIDIELIEKMKTFLRHNLKAVYKFESIKEMLGFRCAEISYHVADSLRIESGEMLSFLLSGTVHFAIDEGFVVSEMMDIKHDQLNREDKKIITAKIKRKLRMIDYKPYTGKRYIYRPKYFWEK